MFFSPVCFLPCRAAWPEVVKVSAQRTRVACGHGYFFLQIFVGLELGGGGGGAVVDGLLVAGVGAGTADWGGVGAMWSMGAYGYWVGMLWVAMLAYMSSMYWSLVGRMGRV